MTSGRLINCAIHGRVPWQGQVVCSACHAVWHLNVHNPPKHNECTCGKPLVGKQGTARAICASCYDSLSRASRGVG